MLLVVISQGNIFRTIVCTQKSASTTITLLFRKIHIGTKSNILPCLEAFNTETVSDYLINVMIKIIDGMAIVKDIKNDQQIKFQGFYIVF